MGGERGLPRATSPRRPHSCHRAATATTSTSTPTSTPTCTSTSTSTLQVINDPDHNNMYLIMEFVAGGDLSAPITRKEEISEPRMRVWMRDAVQGLEYLHSFSILQRAAQPGRASEP